MRLKLTLQLSLLFLIVFITILLWLADTSAPGRDSRPFYTFSINDLLDFNPSISFFLYLQITTIRDAKGKAPIERDNCSPLPSKCSHTSGNFCFVVIVDNALSNI